MYKNLTRFTASDSTAALRSLARVIIIKYSPCQISLMPGEIHSSNHFQQLGLFFLFVNRGDTQYCIRAGSA